MRAVPVGSGAPERGGPEGAPFPFGGRGTAEEPAAAATPDEAGGGADYEGYCELSIMEYR